MDNIELLINKLEHILTIIPENHPLSDCLASHIKSCYYCAPEAIDNRILLIAGFLGYYMGEPNNEEWEDWQRKVYNIWMQPLDNNDIEEPTELENDIDFSDCDITLLSQKEKDYVGDDGDIWLD